MPPNLAFDPESFAAFLEILPKDAQSYLALANKADPARVEPFLDTTGVGTIRHAIEPRHQSFDAPEVNALLGRHNVARVIADTLENPARELTADFAYCRLQGPARPDASGYADSDIADWAQTMGRWRDAGRDVYAYFVHEDKLHAPANAIALHEALGISRPGD